MTHPLLLARMFAMKAHGAIDQRRSHTNVPYIIHPAAVARIVLSVTDDTAMIQAAWLHDVVEDTSTTRKEIARVFGNDVADLVLAVTNVSRKQDGDRVTRKAIDKAHLAKASARAQTIKLADILDNTRNIAMLDPAFAKVYVDEKLDVLAVLTDGDATLYRRVRDQLASAQLKLAA